MPLPQELPESPKGWSRQLLMHLNFGPKGGAATYTVKDSEGNDTPIIYGYDTRKGGGGGFILPDIEGYMTWKELRAAWPKWLSEHPT